MGMNLKLSSSASGTRNVIVNMGGGANLIQRSLFSTSTPTLPYSQWYTPGAGSPAVSTADYYLMNGIWQGIPYDLDTMGAPGATIKAREGKRFVWMMGCDHPDGVNYQGSGDFYVGYSNDPQILPDTVQMLLCEHTSISVVDEFGTTQNTFFAYHYPYLVYNPDSAGDKFWVYAEAQSTSSSRQHQLALFTTADFLSSTLVGPVIATQNFNGWTSLGYVTRLGTGSWEAYSLSNRTSFVGFAKYTSTDGLSWTQGAAVAGSGPYTDIAGQKYLLTVESRTDNDYISLLAVNSSRVSLGTYTRISSAFGPSSGSGSAYPGPTYLQGSWGYEEDGILSIYASRGFFSAGPAYTLNTGPYLSNSPTFFDITGSITSNVLTVTATPGTIPLAVGFQLQGLNSQPKITSFGTGSGGLGSYNVSSTPDQPPGTTITISTNGGLWQQFIDLYYYVTNATSAADAAPLGVTADCVSGTVTVSWNDCLPNRTYRIYRGTTVGTQATLIGDVTGVSITDTPTVGSQYFYKVVTLNSGVEKKSRIVNVYCSNNTRMVTRHVNRVINDGGSFQSIVSDIAFLASVDSYLTSNDYYKYLMHWVDARFGIKVDGSGFVSKVYCLGTTRLPRGGDYTPTTSNTFPSTTSNTSYSATSFRGATPSWINNAASAHGYFGNGRANTIQRKNEITLIAAYQRPSGTGNATLFGSGQFSGGMYLQQASGSSGNISFAMYASAADPSSGPITATVAFASATTAKVVAGVFDGSNMTAYLDGVAGTPVSASAYANSTMLNDNVLRGDYQAFSSGSVALVSGGRTGRQARSARTYSIDNEALFTGACLAVFEKGSASIVSGVGAFYT